MAEDAAGPRDPWPYPIPKRELPADPSRNVALTSRQRKAARLVAEDVATNAEIGRACRVTARQVERWKLLPPFRALVDELRAAFAERVRREGFPVKELRLAALDAAARVLRAQLWAAEFKATEVKIAGDGGAVEVAVFDKDRYAAWRATLDDIAAELGERRPDQAQAQQAPALLVLADPRLANIFEAEWAPVEPVPAVEGGGPHPGDAGG